VMSSMLFLIIIAVFVIYLVLGILYESFVHPATILTGLPFALFGGLLALYIFRMPLDVYGFVALILLLGIVKKNAIMMTTFAALMGALPIALGSGAGSESRRPLGVAVVGGLAFSQLVTLYVTPVFYTYFDELPKRWTAWRHRVRAAFGGARTEAMAGD